MTSEEIKKLIQNGEKIDIEFKESQNALSKDVYDSKTDMMTEMSSLLI